MRRFAFVLLAAALVAPVLAGQSPGQIRPRPAQGRQPEFQPPTIREYKPKSTLVVPQHPVPHAKFPVIDIHSHQPTPISAGEFERVVKGMEDNNLRVLVNLSGSSGEQLRRGIDAIRASKYRDRMVLFANVDFRQAGPGFGAKAARQLEEDIKAGALGLKIFKDLGMFDRKADGSRLKVDDPELDPIWETCAKLNVPVLIHIAEPQAFFDPPSRRPACGWSWTANRCPSRSSSTATCGRRSCSTFSPTRSSSRSTARSRSDCSGLATASRFLCTTPAPAFLPQMSRACSNGSIA